MERMVLHRDLTGLNMLVIEHAPSHVVATLASVVKALKESHLQSLCDTARAPVTTIRDAFRESNTRRLLALCQVGDTDNLPPVSYQAWASKKKNDQVQHILQDHLDSCATVLESEASFVTTAALKAFQNLRFSDTDGNNVSDGLLPFVFIPRHKLATTTKQGLEALSQVDTYGDMLTMSGNLLSLSDSKTLSKSAAFIPVTWRQALSQITGYLPVLTALLGGEHPLTLSYQQGLSYVTEQPDTSEETFSQDPNVGGRLAPALLVYCFHGRVRSWMADQWKRERPVVPLSFTLGFENLIYFGQMNWPPNIRNFPELLALKTASGNNPGTRTPRSTSERPAAVERQVRVLNEEMDPRLLPSTALGKRMLSTKILDAVKSMRGKGKDFCLRDDGEQ